MRKYFRGVETTYTQHYAVLSEVNSAYIKENALLSAVGYCLYSALRRNFGAWILLIISKTQDFRGVDTVYPQ